MYIHSFSSCSRRLITTQQRILHLTTIATKQIYSTRHIAKNIILITRRRKFLLLPKSTLLTPPVFQKARVHVNIILTVVTDATSH